MMRGVRQEKEGRRREGVRLKRGRRSKSRLLGTYKLRVCLM